MVRPGNVKQLFAYFGGKQAVASRLVPMIPEHELFVELFAGGLAVFFRKTNAKLNIVNDLNSLIANLYSVLSSSSEVFEEFVFRVKWLVQSKDMYKYTELWYKDFMKLKLENETWWHIPNINAAVMYYYYIQNSFNQQINTGLSDKPSNWNTGLVDRLWEIRRKFDHVVVENLPYEKVVKKYHDKAGSFWFVDPPYVVTEKVPYYEFNFGIDEHKKLHEQMNKVNQFGGKIMITYDKLEIIEDLYSEEHWNQIPFKMHYASNNKDVEELVIVNYELPKQEELKL
ncbi:MAG: DNA adenine methylase [Candidatus Scalindua sp.]|jgi:DNA adenine methylase|nr:DNA adenine methylase [Candidatus Scalindua sp.]